MVEASKIISRAEDRTSYTAQRQKSREKLGHLIGATKTKERRLFPSVYSVYKVLAVKANRSLR